MSMLQIPLDLTLEEEFTFENFYIGLNQELITRSTLFCKSPTSANLYIWGPSSSGKSHLLQACCHTTSQLKKTSIYLDLDQVKKYGPVALDSLDTIELVCLDNIDSVCDDAEFNEALFHLYNRLQEKQHKLIVSAKQSPHHLNCQLADLKSRLSASLTFTIKPLDDHGKAQAIILRAANRGLILSEEACKFLLRYTRRDMQSLYSTLKQLDQASLAEQRKITVPFIKSIIDLQ